MSHTQQVREYYNRNTRLFLAFGREQQTRTIHRAVWAQGVATLADALAYVNTLVLAQARELAAQGTRVLRILDLGCGVGGTLFDLEEQLRAEGIQLKAVGISISSTQLQIAQHTANQRKSTIHFVEANFLDLPFSTHFDLAIGIESFVHAPDPIALYRAAAAILGPGGRLLVCDDFLCDNAQDQLLEAAFRRGWLAAGLLTPTQAAGYARQAGLQLRTERDLTPELRLLGWPDTLVRMLLHVGMQLPLSWALMQNFVGGLALQHGLGRGIFGYRWNVFERVNG